MSDGKLNPVTPMPNKEFPKKPPTSAPAIPSSIAEIIPPAAGAGNNMFAPMPAINPNIIQLNIFMLS